jgi:hypothetical protein
VRQLLREIIPNKIGLRHRCLRLCPEVRFPDVPPLFLLQEPHCHVRARELWCSKRSTAETRFAPYLDSLSTVKAYAGEGAVARLLLVNLDENKDVNATVQIVNDSRNFVVNSLVYGKAQYDDSQNNVWSPPMSQSLGVASGSFAIDLPPWSITAITLSAQ